MYTHPQRRKKLRSKAGSWLRELREKRGLSQRELAQKVGAEYYTFISQLEHGRGRIPPDRYLVWADALGVNPPEFIRGLMSYYGPMTPPAMTDPNCTCCKGTGWVMEDNPTKPWDTEEAAKEGAVGISCPRCNAPTS